MLRHGFSGIEKCSSILEQPWLKFSNEVVEDNVEVEDDRINIVKMDLVIVVVLVLARVLGRGRSRCCYLVDAAVIIETDVVVEGEIGLA